MYCDRLPVWYLTSPAGRLDVKKLIDWGDMIIESMLVYHRTMNDAITALDQYSNLPPPSTYERMLL